MTDFSDLLEQAQKLSSELDGTSELPRVERSLKQILDASNELYSRVAFGGTKDMEANLLLGSKGIDLSKMIKKLEAISTKRTLEAIEPVSDLDIESLLENEIRNKLMQIFDDEVNEVSKLTCDNAWEHQQAEWKQEKRKILNAMGGRSGIPVEVRREPILLEDNIIPSIGFLNPHERVYAAKLMEYNLNLQRGKTGQNLINTFSLVAEEFQDAKVRDIWDIMKYMVQLSPFPQSEDPIVGRYSPKIVQDLVGQGKKYLEDRYKTYMNNIVTDNLVQANRGGIPGTYPLVRSFVGLRLQGEYLGLRDGTIDERPLWPMVYYCLRAGDVAAAIYCLKKSAGGDFGEIVKLMELKLKSPEGKDVQMLEEHIRFAYRRYIRNETDPFKRIIWAVLGCCDVTDDHSEVASTVDDYLWLKLSQVRVSNEQECIKYHELQKMILEEYGEQHYDAHCQPHLYFQVLALTGQFEAAVEFLFRVNTYQVHAVHMAIALHELYLLGGPQDTAGPLICYDPADPKPARRLNLARIIVNYVRMFEINCLNEAIHYYYQLRNYKDPDGKNFFERAVADLALETKQYEIILGEVQGNGLRSKGLLDQFTNCNVSAVTAAETIGHDLVKKGQLEEAIDVFAVSNNQEEILSHMCVLLSQVVSSQSSEGLRGRLRDKSLLFSERFSKDGWDKCSPVTVSSFIKLKELLFFFDLYHAKEYQQALKVLSEIELVPFKQEDVPERIRTFRVLKKDVAKVLPDVLLAAMNSIFAQYQKIKAENEYVPRYHERPSEMLSHLRLLAKTITNYAGMLPFRLPGDTNSRLMQMEILMH